MKYRRLISVLLSVILTAVLIIPVSLPVSAANKRFITELRVAAGEDAAAALEEDGWSVTMVGLNITTDSPVRCSCGIIRTQQRHLETDGQA